MNNYKKRNAVHNWTEEELKEIHLMRTEKPKTRWKAIGKMYGVTAAAAHWYYKNHFLFSQLS